MYDEIKRKHKENLEEKLKEDIDLYIYIYR
jgi:hypothetical protein